MMFKVLNHINLQSLHKTKGRLSTILLKASIRKIVTVSGYAFFEGRFFEERIYLDNAYD